MTHLSFNSDNSMNVSTPMHSSTMATKSLFLSQDDNSDIEFANVTTHVTEMDLSNETNYPIVSVGSISKKFSNNLEASISS